MTVGIRACQGHRRTGAQKAKETEPIKSAGERRVPKRDQKMVAQEAGSMRLGFTCPKSAASKHPVTKA